MAESKREHLQVPLPCNLVAVLPAVDLESLSQSTLSRSIRIALSPNVLLQQRQHTQQRAARESRLPALLSALPQLSPRLSVTQYRSIPTTTPLSLSLRVRACLYSLRVCIRPVLRRLLLCAVALFVRPRPPSQRNSALAALVR